MSFLLLRLVALCFAEGCFAISIIIIPWLWFDLLSSYFILRNVFEAHSSHFYYTTHTEMCLWHGISIMYLFAIPKGLPYPFSCLFYVVACCVYCHRMMAFTSPPPRLFPFSLNKKPSDNGWDICSGFVYLLYFQKSVVGSSSLVQRRLISLFVSVYWFQEDGLVEEVHAPLQLE